MTTGRINQVTILLAALPSQYSLTCGKESKEKVLASHKCTVRVCHTVHKWFHRQRQYDSTQADHYTVPAQRRFIPFFFPRLQVPSNEHCRNLGITQPEGSFPGHPSSWQRTGRQISTADSTRIFRSSSKAHEAHTSSTVDTVHKPSFKRKSPEIGPSTSTDQPTGSALIAQLKNVQQCAQRVEEPKSPTFDRLEGVRKSCKIRTFF